MARFFGIEGHAWEWSGHLEWFQWGTRLWPGTPRVAGPGRLSEAEQARGRASAGCAEFWPGRISTIDQPGPSGRAVPAAGRARAGDQLLVLLEQHVVTHDESFQDVWNGELMQTLRSNLIKKKPNKSRACAGCDLPYDASKFTFRNKLKAARRRMQLFSR